VQTRVRLLVAALLAIVGIVAAPSGVAQASGNPVFEIAYESTGLAIDSQGTTVWKTLTVTPWRNTSSQRWATNVVDNPWSWSVNEASGLCMVTGGAARVGDPVVQGAGGFNGYSEWGNVAAPGPWTGRVHIVNRATGLCVSTGPTDSSGQTTLWLQPCGQSVYFIYHQVG
jgi:hypothetical protein